MRKWIDPTFWRDQGSPVCDLHIREMLINFPTTQLPRDIAIQERLQKRNAHDHYVHRYYSHRLHFAERKYRVFNDVCDLRDLRAALDFYSQAWRRRRNQYRWLETNDDLRRVLNDDNATATERDVARKNAWDSYAVYRGLLEGMGRRIRSNALTSGDSEDSLACAATVLTVRELRSL